MQRTRTPVSRRITWAPGWRLRFVLLATTAGSVCGLVFGLTSLNRPLVNAATFYVIGAVLAALAAGLVIAVRGRLPALLSERQRRRRAGSPRRHR